jgi:hypothetical protein
MVLGSKAEFWLVLDSYIYYKPGSETDIALVLNWYCLKSLPSMYWCEAGLA